MKEGDAGRNQKLGRKRFFGNQRMNVGRWVQQAVAKRCRWALGPSIGNAYISPKSQNISKKDRL